MIRVEGAVQKVDIQRFTRVPKLLYGLLFTLLASRTDASLVCMSLMCHQTIKTFKFRSFSNSLTFRPFWQKLVDLCYVHNSWSTAVFAKPFAHKRFPTCITDCGLRGRPLCIGSCHCLQVVIEMKYCSAGYRPV